MVDKQAIREWSGKIIGWVETDSTTGNKIVRDFYGKILGRYDKSCNVTRDFYGRVLYKGDQVGLLLKK